jgi:hypothetical protein
MMMMNRLFLLLVTLSLTFAQEYQQYGDDYQEYADGYQQDNLYADYAMKQQDKAVG